MSKPAIITKEITAKYGIIWIDPFSEPDIPVGGLSGVCKWWPDLAKADIGRTNLTIGLVHALPYKGKPQMSIKEKHQQAEVFIVLAELQLGLSKTMEVTADDVEWVILRSRSLYVIPAGVIHVPPVSATSSAAPMLVLQGTKNPTKVTDVKIAHPQP